MADSINRSFNREKMATNTLKNFILPVRTAVYINRVRFSTSTPFMIKRRYKNDIEPNPNRFGPLTNLPDYSFVDGRPVPIGANIYKRLEHQKILCKKMIDQYNEIEVAVKDYEHAQREEKIAQENLHKSRLKEKGNKLKSLTR